MKKICKIGLDISLSMIVMYMLLFIFSGCSSKKKTIDSDKKQITVSHSENSENSENSSANIKVDTKLIMDDKTKTVSVIKKYLPVDATKPATIIDSEGKKHELNNVAYTEETTTEHKDLKTENSDNSEVFRKKESVGKTESKGKVDTKIESKKMDLDKSGFNLWSWLWMLILIIMVVVFIYLNNHFSIIKRVTAFFKK